MPYSLVAHEDTCGIITAMALPDSERRLNHVDKPYIPLCDCTPMLIDADSVINPPEEFEEGDPPSDGSEDPEMPKGDTVE